MDSVAQDRSHILPFRQVRIINGVDFGYLGLHEPKSPCSRGAVDEEHAGGAVHVAESSAHLANGACSPDGDDVAFGDRCVDHAVPGCGKDIGEEEAFLIGDVGGELEKVDVAEGDADVLGLAAGKAACEVRVSE